MFYAFLHNIRCNIDAGIDHMLFVIQGPDDQGPFPPDIGEID
jgi:hypothetical protein